MLVTNRSRMVLTTMAAGLDSSTVGLDTNMAPGLNHTQPYPVHIDMDGLAAEAFFQTYYSLERFIVECVLATLAAGCNVTALVVDLRSRSTSAAVASSPESIG